MPNPKGNPESLKGHGFKTDRDKPLTGRLAFRVTEEVEAKVKSLDNYPEFCRQAIAKALSELEGSGDEIT
ncbi:hypothetical protein [Tolypothrix sp. VBCCA 56010]|uniref:hypothetical protein n=1 Tax=Tolypothrix sp. VBCCA 56010 TaxID=3137731 RepID=UPI003D7EC4F9